jgi:hypothetical protein
MLKINRKLVLEWSCKVSQLSIGRYTEFGQEYVLERNFSVTEQSVRIGLIYFLNYSQLVSVKRAKYQ